MGLNAGPAPPAEEADVDDHQDERRSRTGGPPEPDGLKIGLLASLTGRLARTETSMHKGALLAVAEVNAAGGVRGRELIPVTADYASDCAAAAAAVRRLAEDEGVLACVGGYTSASRVAMQPGVHAHRSLLVYPTYFEGLETDTRTFYSGAAPNQFLVDYVHWILANLGDRLHIVGSDYVYPRTLAAIVCAIARAEGAEIVAERYVPLGETDFRPTIAEIDRTRPHVVVSNIVGTGSTSAFYRQFAEAGHTSATLPIAATVTTELDLQEMGAEYGVGHYMAATYFDTVDGPAGRRYAAAFAERFGAHEVTHVAQVGAYNAVRILAAAAEQAAEPSTEAIRRAMVGIRVADNPEGGPLTVHDDHYTSHPSYIGRGRADGRFEIVGEYPVRAPDPYPALIVPTWRRPGGHDVAFATQSG